MSKQENYGRPEKPLEKTREIDNEARVSKKAEMKRKFSRNQKTITLWDIIRLRMRLKKWNNGAFDKHLMKSRYLLLASLQPGDQDDLWIAAHWQFFFISTG